MQGLIYSVALHIEEVAGLTVGEAGTGPCLSDYMNPWERPEANMAKMRAGHSVELGQTSPSAKRGK